MGFFIKNMLLCLLILVDFVAGIPLQDDQYIKVDKDNVCLDTECVNAAAEMLKKMNLDSNPCEDFYEFACGRFVKETFIPDEKSSVDTFDTISDKLEQQLRIMLEESIQETEIMPYKQAKRLYKTCMNTSQIEQQGEEPVLEVLKLFGGIPAIEGKEWNEKNFSWVETVKKFRQIGIGIDYLIDFSVAIDKINSTRRQIEFDQPPLRLGREFLIKGREDPNVIAYFEYLRDLMVLLGSDLDIASKDMSDMIDFEINMAKIAKPREQRRNARLLYNPITVEEMQKTYIWLDWLGYINAILPPDVTVDINEVINIVDVSFLKNLGELLEQTPKRTIANFLLTQVATESVEYLTKKLRSRQQEYLRIINGQAEEEARWKLCTKTLDSKIPIAVSSMYVRRYFDENAKKIALKMVQDIKQEFANTVKSVEWMDNNTRDRALKKLQTMATLIAYPDELKQNETLIEYYKDLKIEETSYLQKNYELYRFKSDLAYRKLLGAIIKNEWKTWPEAARVNAHYDKVHNNINFRAAILQDHFFSAGRPKYLNYAAIGSVIGHEITHGFDDEGSQFDSDGNLNDWWDPATKIAFKQKVKCMINQYNATVDLQTNLTLNGVTTQGENIADNGGIQVAYNAYKNYVNKYGIEQSLPGLKYNPQQLYWVAMSQNWCSKYRPKYLKLHITEQAHPPGKYRVLIPLMNNKDFANDFECPTNSKMNPEMKCQVW